MRIALQTLTLAALLLIISACQSNTGREGSPGVESAAQPLKIDAEAPEYFRLRPEVEKLFGYTHAVRIGPTLKVSGAVSMDSSGNLSGAGDLEQQMKNVYVDLRKILDHYGYSFDDVVVENVFTTDMAKFLAVSAYRNSIYTQQFPTATWLEVKGLAGPGFLIEIELEAHKAN